MWSMPEDVKVDSILVVEHGRLPIDEAVEGYHGDHCCRCYERAAPDSPLAQGTRRQPNPGRQHRSISRSRIEPCVTPQGCACTKEHRNQPLLNGEYNQQGCNTLHGAGCCAPATTGHAAALSPR